MGGGTTRTQICPTTLQRRVKIQSTNFALHNVCSCSQLEFSNRTFEITALAWGVSEPQRALECHTHKCYEVWRWINYRSRVEFSKKEFPVRLRCYSWCLTCFRKPILGKAQRVSARHWPALVFEPNSVQGLDKVRIHHTHFVKAFSPLGSVSCLSFSVLTAETQLIVFVTVIYNKLE